jgi:hypothetical protein
VEEEVNNTPSHERRAHVRSMLRGAHTTVALSVLQRIIDGIDHLAWSAIVDFENAQHPLVDRRTEIARWAQCAVANVVISEQVSARAQALPAAGFGALDAAHVACAETAACDCLLTCDDRLIRAARRVQLAVRVQNPVEYVEEQTHVWFP